MSSDSMTNTELGTGSKPPVLQSGADYLGWKLRYENFLCFHDPDLWESITEGNFIPATLSADPTYNNKQVSLKHPNLTADDIKRIKIDIKAFSALKMALPLEVYMCCKEFKTAKTLWLQLEAMFDGKGELKKIRNNKLKYQFETFHHVEGETVSQQLHRFTQLVNELRSNDMKYSNEDLALKLLHNFPSDWKHNVTMIKRTTDLITKDLTDIMADIESLEIV
jgi:hypothetical protein